nr:MAG TPA: hypothetical protein [Caudoviricetes sp.]
MLLSLHRQCYGWQTKVVLLSRLFFIKPTRYEPLSRCP